MGSELRTVVFVCRHGALRSRLAAAFFNQYAPPGWRADSAGLEPQENPSQAAADLLAADVALRHLDVTPPRELGRAASPNALIAIDCSVPGEETWSLDHQDSGENIRDELNTRVRELAQRLAARR